ncbi:hypothetical protein FB451DRAFT_1264775 [Mycena latifolia]|nr:hypothetical protein FB451DRAFT_1264775 [Mycena latifolia]
MITTLLRVCHGVHTWIEPLLYRVLGIPCSGESLISTVESAIYAVRHLFLSPNLSRLAREKNVLRHCSGIVNLFIDGVHPDVCGSADSVESWAPLASLPALTHLCLSESMATALLSGVVATCPNLLVALTMIDDLEDESALFVGTLQTITDPRVVVTSLTKYCDHWAAGARDSDDMWVHAEKFLARKRRGEIPSTRDLLRLPC